MSQHDSGSAPYEEKDMSFRFITLSGTATVMVLLHSSHKISIKNSEIVPYT